MRACALPPDPTHPTHIPTLHPSSPPLTSLYALLVQSYILQACEMPETLGGSFVLKGSTDGTSPSTAIKLNEDVQPYAGPFINAVVTYTGSSGTITVTAVGSDNSITLDTAVPADTDLTFTVPVSAQESDDAATPLLYPFPSPPPPRRLEEVRAFSRRRTPTTMCPLRSRRSSPSRIRNRSSPR